MSEKLEFFEETIKREADRRLREERRLLIAKLEEEEKITLENEQKRIQTWIDDTTYELEKTANREVAKTLREAKAEYYLTQRATLEEARKEVVKMLKQFTKTKEYSDYLVQKIKESKSEIFTKVMLCDEDMHIAEEIKKLGLEPQQELDKNDFFGGFVLVGENIKADFTFKSRLDEVLV